MFPLIVNSALKLLLCRGYSRHVVKICPLYDECVAGRAPHRQNAPSGDRGSSVVLDEVCMCVCEGSFGLHQE